MTAVEWLAIQLYEKMEMKGDGKVFDELLEQAKEMEKEQTMQGLSFKLTKENQKALYVLKLHESKVFECDLGTQLEVIRVAGGWIYQYVRLDAKSMWAVFVPFDNEFKLVSG